MTLNKKEKIMILVLIGLIYAFAFVKLVVIDSLPKIKSTQTRLSEVKAQKETLDLEYLNINSYKAEIKTREVVDERLGDYLMENADISDSILFVESLAVLLNTELQSISVGSPQQLSSEGMQYYGFPVSFSAQFSYGGFQEIIRYCEGGAKKVCISSFNLTPAKEGNDQYSVSMGLVFYSINRESADRLYEFSRSRFKEFTDREGAPIFIEDDARLTVNTPVKVSAQNNGQISIDNADFFILHRGYLYAGENFQTYSSFNVSKRSRITTKEKVDVILTLNGTEYTIESMDSQGKKDTLRGTIPERALTLYIMSELDPKVKENEKLQVNITIKNDSDQSIRVKVDETGGRMKLMDRDGTEIKAKSDKEKVYIQ